MKKVKLSKSTFIRGLQCEKSLYLYKHHYKLKDPTPPSLQTVFDQGTDIGILSQKIFPNGVDSSPQHHFKMMESVSKTLDFINKGESIIYEATFQYDDVIVALDILVKDDEGWKAYEVKSSTKVTDTYIKDASIQYYTIVNSGIELKDISIVHINNQYTRGEKLDINQLFTIKSVHDEVLEFMPRIPNEVKRLKNVIKSSEIPLIDIGTHCSDPYDCEFKGTCWKHIPEYSVFDISNLKKDKKIDLYQQGIITLNQIDLNDTSLNPNQRLQVKSEIEKSTHINQNKIRKFINELKYPLYFLDFETIRSPIPIFKKSRPYQQVVFQYSLHIKESPDSEIYHSEYLANPTEDPRLKFVKQIIKDCGNHGDVLVYNIGFERSKLIDLIDVFPEYSKELKGIVNRLKDLMIPFQQKWYYTPQMKGSYSIKNVLPAMVPELSYNDLEIKEGGIASDTFLQMINKSFKGDEELTRKQLLKYCKLDTLAMVKILKKLESLID